MRVLRVAFGLAALLTFAPTSVGCMASLASQARIPEPSENETHRWIGHTEQGFATWYSDSLAGRRTASGVPYDPRSLTAAHRTLPFGTRVRVTRIDNGRTVEVRINDRGPFGNAARIVDLSRAAAERLQMLSAGVVPVRLEVLEIGPWRRRRR